MPTTKSVRCVAALLWLASAALATGVPLTVSPGVESGVAAIDFTCPTFSWSAVSGARAYELAIYRVDEGAVAAHPELIKKIPGGALSWTPAVGECLTAGGEYAWTVRARQRRGATAWSTPSLFIVDTLPSEEEFEQALTVVRRYLAVHEAAQPEAAMAAERSAGTGSGRAEKDQTGRPTPPAALGGSDFSVDAGGNVQANSFWGPLDCWGCITYDDIAFQTITGTEIDEDAVTTFHIDDGTITNIDIQGDSIYSSHIVDGQVGIDDLGSNSVGNDELKGVVPVQVECDGACTNVTLAQACAAAGSGYEAIGIACQYLQDYSGSTCGSGKCSAGSFGSGSDVDEFCTNDPFGWDAIVFCLND
jgi:hypothetical protein